MIIRYSAAVTVSAHRPAAVWAFKSSRRVAVMRLGPTVTLRAQGDFDGARHLSEQVLDARRRILGDDHPNTLAVASNVGAVFLGMDAVEALRTLMAEMPDAFEDDDFS
jgi:hypothetical protein